MLILDMMGEPHNEHHNTPDSSPNSSDSESPSSEPENMLRSVNEPDVSLDEMLSLACRQGKLDIVQLLLQSGAHVNHRNQAGNTPLLEACSQGHVSVANFLLENGSKIDAPTETTLDSALTWACTLGNTVIVDALLKKKADVEHRTKDGCTALMFACLAGHRDVAEKLLDSSSEINVESDSNKDSPLTFACWKGHCDVVELLLGRKANIEHRTKEGFSPLMFAALGGHTKVARKLLDRDAQVNVPSGSNNDIPLTSACWKGHHDVVQLLLEFSSSIEHRTKDGCTPLMLAAREGHICVAELLLMNNAQVNVPSGSENNIPLTLACWKGHCEVVRLLLDYGSDIEHRNKAGCTPLMLAAREGHFETTALLLERDAQVNIPSGSNDDTPLTLACWKGHKEVVLLLLDSKSNIDHQTKTGCTPLMEATREGHKDVAEILLNHNADVELPDNYGQSPLFMACWKGHRDVAELLLQQSAYRDCRTKTGITPLFQACRENHISIVELLLEYGAGVNNPFPNSRENPMTLCAEKGHKELVDLLLLKGGIHDCRTKKGCTPAFLACKEGHIDIAKRLADKGANIETPDCRGNTPIMSAYKNGHVTVVDWLIKFVHHLPSDELCHKILMSSVDEKEKELIVQHRSKCLAIIQETKKKREQLALKNAQNLVQELDDERNREEKKKKKRRDKRKRKKNRETDTDGAKINGIHPDHDDDDDNDEEEDNIVPRENRAHSIEEKLAAEIEVLKISEIPTLLVAKSEISVNNINKKNKRSDKNKLHQEAGTVPCSTEFAHKRNHKKNRKSSVPEVKPVCSATLSTYAETTSTNKRTTQIISSKAISLPTSHIDVVHLLANRLTDTSTSSNASNKTSFDINRKLPKTTGVCTQSSSTLGPSRSTTLSQRVNLERTSDKSVLSNSNSIAIFPVVSSIASTTSTQVTTTQSDPRTEVKNITPVEACEDWSEEIHMFNKHEKNVSRSDLNSVASHSVPHNNSFDEYRESDWKEISRTTKVALFELTVPNGFCGRVIGKGGKKINLITEESGAQITIDKPPANVVPADRVISIKGNPQSVERARYLVTKALNTPSLSTRAVGVFESEFMYLTETNVLSSYTHENNVNTKTVVTMKESKLKQPKNWKFLHSMDIPVTPLLSYSKVATGTISLDTHKQLRLKTHLSNNSDRSNQSKTLKRNSSEHPDSDTDSSCSRRSISKENSPTNTGFVTSPPLQTTGFGSKDFSYFSQERSNLSDQNKQGPLQSISTFVELNEDLPREQFPWKIAENSHNNSGNAADNGPVDRNRSVSWTGNPKKTDHNTTDPGIRSLSTEAINDRQGAVVSPWNMISQLALSTDELSDEPVFSDEILWSGKTKDDHTTASTGNEGWDLSSSPTSSSVSSSKVELTNILDNDSGVGGSNPLGRTPTSEHSESRTSLQDPPYLETALENTPWLQSRGAYSAPSSPALQRNNENNSRTCSLKPQNIRSHPSMEELNSSRPWLKKANYHDQRAWDNSKTSPPPLKQYKAKTKQNSFAEDNDSGLPSPANHTDRHIKCNDGDGGISGNTTPWSAERFQDVHTVADVLSQLLLDKYAVKFEEQNITLESLVTLSEKDLQTFDIPKGPRLKILKACDVIKNQQRRHVPIASNAVQSSQTLFTAIPPPLHQQLLDSQQVFSNNKQIFPSTFRYPDYMPYPIQQQPYNVIMANNQPYICHSVHPTHPVQQTVYTTCEEFVNSVPQVERMQPTTGFMFPENPAYYFYPPQS